MQTVSFKMKGISPYSQSRLIQTPKTDRETSKDHEARTWKERLHSDKDGNVFMPPMAVKNGLSECAKFISMSVPGKGKATYTKHFEAGVLCLEPIMLFDSNGDQIKRKDVTGEWLFVPSDGKRGGGKRVEKCFPVIESGWTGTASLLVLDPMITPDILRLHLERMGQFIGLGRFRPRNNGFYGRFNISNIEWSTYSMESTA